MADMGYLTVTNELEKISDNRAVAFRIKQHIPFTMKEQMFQSFISSLDSFNGHVT